MYNLKKLILIVFLIIFAGCGSSNSNATSSAKTDNNSTSNSNIVEVESIVKAIANIDKLTVDVHKNSYDITIKMLTDVNSMLHSFVNMDESVVRTMNLNMNLLNSLAQPVGITENYKSFFSIADKYDSSSPAFNLTGTLKKNYFLLSSETPFFVEKKTVKSYFTDAASLTKAWKRALSVADKKRNLYLSIVEIDKENITHKVSNALLIKSTEFPL